MSRVLLLDVMGTLVHDPFHDVMPAFFGMHLSEMLASKHPSAWIEFELGRRDEPTFLASFFADGRAYDHVAFVAAVSAAYRLLPGIEPLLADLSSAGVPMHAASNYPPWYRRIEARTGLSRYVSWTFVSCELGVRKPDAAFFRVMTERLGVAPAECVFVDDQTRNTDAAQAFGMDAIVFEDADALRSELVRRRLLPP